ncbi:MAG: FtsQ-type POTRA domain-containing protein, partial [Clostridiales bacterium]|nr:FtsQ-type POTRA domain-containing protein [Clostridiales bacterium]
MKGTFKYIGIVCIVTLSLILFISMPIFKIKTVTVSGQLIISEDAVKEALSYDGTNIFSANTKNALQKLSNNSYIKSVDLKKSFPNSVEVNIIERIPAGYV